MRKLAQLPQPQPACLIQGCNNLAVFYSLAFPKLQREPFLIWVFSPIPAWVFNGLSKLEEGEENLWKLVFQ